jgi:hypothetical protein
MKANETYWDSSEARNLFQPTVEESNALEAVKNQIKLLHEGLETPTSCLYLIADFKENDNQKLTEYQIWTLQRKCMVTSLTLLKATEMMVNVKNWDFCCKTAIVEAAKLGIKLATTSRTVCNWYCDFHQKENFLCISLLKSFPYPNS